MARLTIITGEGAGSNFDFKENIILGRSPDVNCVLKDLRASRKHSQILAIDDEFYLEDLQSNNGTFLNGRRIKNREKLKNGDNVRIGATWITFVEDEVSLKEGGIFYNYEIIREIHQAESGSFYLAKQVSLSRNVLLWVVTNKAIAKRNNRLAAKIEESFLAQTKEIANLFHRNILMLLDFAATAKHLFCAFECVDLEETVAKYVKKNIDIPIRDVIKISKEVTRGLLYAHSQGILHLHLSDKNIIIEPLQRDRVVLTEFGVSRFLSESTTKVENDGETTCLLEVSKYIAPEQLPGGGEKNESTDVYALGCMLYHLLAGEPPFEGNNLNLLAKQHAHHTLVPVEKKRLDTPPDLAHTIDQCLQKESEERCSLESVLKSLEKVEMDLALQEAFQSKEKLVRKYLGEKALLRWWFFSPVISFFALVIIFFMVRMIK